MKSTKPRLQLFGVALLLFLTAILAGCGKVAQTGENPADTPPSPTSAPALAESAVPEQINSGPQLNMLDVIPMKGVDAHLVVCDVEEITENDRNLGVGQKAVSPWIFIKNTGAEPITVTRSYFVLVDDSGKEYESSFGRPGNLYSGVTLLPDGIIDGPLYFIVPEHATPYSLKAPADLGWDDSNMVEIDLQQSSADPGDEPFVAGSADYYEAAAFVDFDTARIYDDKLALQATDASFIETDEYEPGKGYRLYQVALRVENLTDEELNVTLDYTYYLYSAGYQHLLKQIPQPFADNELFVITLEAKASEIYVLTFEIKEDSAANYLFVQDYYEDYDPVFFRLKAQ